MRTLIKTLAASAAAAVVGSIGTTPDSPWYRALDKPAWQPPSIAFPLVWTPLYVLIAIGTARMIDAEPDPAHSQAVSGRSSVTNLAVNAGWCWAFFSAESPRAGLVTIVALDGLNMALLNEARKRDTHRCAGIWRRTLHGALFATALNAEILRPTQSSESRPLSVRRPAVRYSLANNPVRIELVPQSPGSRRTAGRARRVRAASRVCSLPQCGRPPCSATIDSKRGEVLLRRSSGGTGAPRCSRTRVGMRSTARCRRLLRTAPRPGTRSARVRLSTHVAQLAQAPLGQRPAARRTRSR